MTVHRIAWKLPAIFSVCSFGALALALLRGIGRIRPAGHARREDRLVRLWARTMAAILGMGVRTRGTPPRGAFLLVSNHLSYIDVLAFMSQVDARLLAKSDVKNWPLLGPLASFAGTLFVDRKRRRDLQRVIGEIAATLEGGRGVVFFPEGTSSPGLEVKPFKPSLFEVAAGGGFEVSTAAVRYTCPPGERPAQWSISWWGEMTFLPHFLGVLRLPGVEAELRFNEQKLAGSDRKQLAAKAQAAVEGIFEPVCAELGRDVLFGGLV